MTCDEFFLCISINFIWDSCKFMRHTVRIESPGVERYPMYNQNKEKRRKANWIGHILRKNCLLTRFIEEGAKERRKDLTRRRGRRSKQLVDDLK